MLPFGKWHPDFRDRCLRSENSTAVFEVDAFIRKMAPRFSRSMLSFGQWHRGFRDRWLRSENRAAVFQAFPENPRHKFPATVIREKKRWNPWASQSAVMEPRAS